MGNHLARAVSAALLALCLGCAPLGYVDVRGESYYFDFAAYALTDEFTAIAMSQEIKQAWELNSTTRHIWISLPGSPAVGTCVIAEDGCRLRYVRNLGIGMGLICASQPLSQKNRCEMPGNYGIWAESGKVVFTKYVPNERIEGVFTVQTPEGPLSGKFRAHFDTTAPKVLSLTPL
jgi:hypothetical protein